MKLKRRVETEGAGTWMAMIGVLVFSPLYDRKPMRKFNWESHVVT